VPEVKNNRYSILTLGGVLTLAALVTACSPGSVTPAFGIPTASPSPSPSAKPSGTLTTSVSGSVPLPALGAATYTVAGSVPVANAAVGLTETLSATAPASVTPLSVRRDFAAPNVDLLYVTFSSTASVTLSQSPALTFTSPSITSGTSYSLGEYVNGTWAAPFGTAQTASGTSVSFPSFATAVTITPTAPVTFVLYSGTYPTPIVSTTSLDFDALNPSPQPFTVSEVNYAGAFTGTMTCTENPAGQTPSANAFVAQFSGATTTSTQTPSSAGGNVTFTVDPGAETGSCQLSVMDAKGNSGTLTVNVSTSSVTIDGAHGR
jgi:hypothetical protein